jgi:sugar lactone lactonase YvrE
MSRTGEYSQFLLPLLTAVSLISGCMGDDITGSTPDYPRTWISEDVVVIDDDPAIRLNDIFEDHLVLETIGGASISAGDLLVGSERGGYIRRARTIENDGSLIRVETRKRYLINAVVSGHDDATYAIGAGSASLVEPAAGGMAETAGPRIDLAGITLYGEGDGSQSVVVERGSLAFSPAVDLGIAINGRTVTRLGFSMKGEMEIDLDIRTDLPYGISHSGITRIASLRQPETMKIGNVPIPVVLELDIYFDSRIEGSTTEPCSAGYIGSHMIDAGMDFSDRWRESGSSAAAFDRPEISVGMMSDCSVRIAVRTDLRVYFYSSETAVIELGPWIEVASEPGQFPVWRWDLTGGLSIARRYEPGIFSRHIPRWEAPAFADSAVLDSGPYESDDHVLLAVWESPGTEKGEFDQPRGIALDSRGHVYVTDQNNHRVLVFDQLGDYLHGWGSYGTSEGRFIFPDGIAAASDGSILVADSGNHRVQRFSSEGTFLGQWGSEGTGEGQFVQLEGIAAGPDTLIAVCDSGTSSFSIYSLSGAFLGRFPSTLAQGAAFDAGSNIYTVGCRSGGVLRSDRAGQPLGILGPDLCATDLAVDGGGSFYVIDYDLDRIAILDPSGSLVSTIGLSGDGPGQLDHPAGVAVSPDGWVYVADTANNRIQVFAPK